VALQQISIGSVNERIWKYYDFGPKEATPLVCIPGASGTADVFYRQIISLCPKGYRIISVQFDAYDTHQAWCKGLDRFLDKIAVNKVHLFGTSLGGYLAQCYAQFRPARVESLILNNAFCDTQYYTDNAPCAAMFSVMPEFMLKRIVLSNFPATSLETEIANSVDFMVEQLETLTQSELAGRLTLNCAPGTLKPGSVILSSEHITILDTIDDVALPENLREEVYKFYPDARVAHLKSGGNFPYLSRADEVNMHIQIHLRRHGLPVQPDSPTQTNRKSTPSPLSTQTESTENKQTHTPAMDTTEISDDSSNKNVSGFSEPEPTAITHKSITNESTPESYNQPDSHEPNSDVSNLGVNGATPKDVENTTHDGL